MKLVFYAKNALILMSIKITISGIRLQQIQAEVAIAEKMIPGKMT